MDPSIPIQPYGLPEEDPSPPQIQPVTAPPEPAALQEPTNSVFQGIPSPWVWSAAAHRSNANPDDDVQPDVGLGTVRRLNGVIPDLANLKIITEEEKEQRKAQRQQDRKDEQLREEKLKAREEEQLRICRNYFIVGCFGLPFLLWINVIYFMREFKVSTGNLRVRKYVWLSLIVALVETFLWILWFVVFQLLRDSTLRVFDITRSNFTIGLLL